MFYVVVLQNLPPAETLHQAFDSLQFLKQVIDDVFLRLGGRVGQEHEKLITMCNRVKSLQVFK